MKNKYLKEIFDYKQTREALLQFIQEGFPSEKDEEQLLIHYWHSYNDAFGRTNTLKPQKRDRQEFRRFMPRLIRIYSKDVVLPDGYEDVAKKYRLDRDFFIAEIYREMGEFEKSLEILNRIRPFVDEDTTKKIDILTMANIRCNPWVIEYPS